MDRVELLNNIRAGRELIVAAVDRFPAEELFEQALPNGWSVKDVMAHLGWWEMRVADIYGALSRGNTPRVVIAADEVDKVNSWVIEEYRQRSREEVQAFEAHAYRLVLTIAETAPDADLFNPRRFSWTDGQAFFNWIVWNTYEHYAEHLALLERRLEELERIAPQKMAGNSSPPLVRAAAFLAEHGRDIDRALFDSFFAGKGQAAGVEALARYQNPDGGFYGLEVEIKAPQSNPFATELALSAMGWLGLPRDHRLLVGALGYLETTQLDDGTWRFTPEIYQGELAPWFQNWQWPNLAPSCSIAGLLRQMGVGSERLHNRVSALFQRLARPEDLLGNDYYTVRPYACYFLSSWDFPQSEYYRWGVVWWMTRVHLANPDLDAAHWLDFVPQPRSSIAQRLPPALLAEELGQLAAGQSEDGGWSTSDDPAWRGWNTVTNLLILRAYGKI
jgi:hypothetical protein